MTDNSPVEEFSNNDKRRELENEIEWRHRVYKRLVSQGKMTTVSASRKIRLMNAILKDYAPDPDLFSRQKPPLDKD